MVPVTHYRSHDDVGQEIVTFAVFKENEWFKAVPDLSLEKRLTTGLPMELVFLYANYCVVNANDMEDDALTAIKRIILELEAQELI